MADIYENKRSIGVLDTGEYGYVRLAVGNGPGTKIITAEPDDAEGFAQDILASVVEARLNKEKWRVERQRIRDENPDVELPSLDEDA